MRTTTERHRTRTESDMTTPTRTRQSHAARAASKGATVTALPVRSQPSAAALADPAAAKRRGETPGPKPAVAPAVRAAVGKRQSQLANKPQPPTTKPAPRRAAKPKPGAVGTPTGGSEHKPEQLTDARKRAIALHVLIEAGAAAVKNWDAKSTGVTQAEAREYISHRLSYVSESAGWADGLAPRTAIASRTTKK
jgi:hypothetical protein